MTCQKFIHLHIFCNVNEHPSCQEVAFLTRSGKELFRKKKSVANPVRSREHSLYNFVGNTTGLKKFCSNKKFKYELLVPIEKINE